MKIRSFGEYSEEELMYCELQSLVGEHILK